MDRPSLRSEAIADLEWVLAWLKNDEDLLIAALMLAGVVARLRGKKHR